jgi:predicted PurR-regulated permease PerM
MSPDGMGSARRLGLFAFLLACAFEATARYVDSHFWSTASHFAAVVALLVAGLALMAISLLALGRLGRALARVAATGGLSLLRSEEDLEWLSREPEPTSWRAILSSGGLSLLREEPMGTLATVEGGA